MKTLGTAARHRDGAAALVSLLPAILLAAPEKPVDANKSALVIHVGKAGMFSAVGHEHLVDAPISRGQFNERAAAQVGFSVDARKMTVRPAEKTSAKDRAKIQETMQTAVLESEKYPEIRFQSTNVTTWRASLEGLPLHGVSKAVSLEGRRDGETWAGRARLKQSGFGIQPGIQPVTVGGGVVKVEDELDIGFRIYAAAE